MHYIVLENKHDNIKDLVYWEMEVLEDRIVRKFLVINFRSLWIFGKFMCND